MALDAPHLSLAAVVAEELRQHLGASADAEELCVSAELGVGYVGYPFRLIRVGDIPVISVTIPGSFFPVSI